MLRVLVKRCLGSYRSIYQSQELNIKLSVASGNSNMREVLYLLQSPSANISHQCFGLRIIARSIKKSGMEKAILSNTYYKQLVENTWSNLEKAGAQEISDFSFWFRVTVLENLSQADDSDIERFMELIQNKLKMDAFTTRQLVSINYDLAKIQIPNFDFTKKISELLKDPKEVVDPKETIQVIIAANESRKSVGSQLLDSISFRLGMYDLQKIDIETVGHLVTRIEALFGKYYRRNLEDQFYRYYREVLSRTSQLELLEMLKVMRIYEITPDLSKSIINSTLERLESILEKDPEEVSIEEFFRVFSILFEIAGKINLEMSSSLQHKIYQRIRFGLKNELVKSNILIRFLRTLHEFKYDLSELKPFLEKAVLEVQLSPNTRARILMSSEKLDLDVSPQELLGDYKAFKTKFKNQPTYKKLPEFDCLVKASKKYPEINNLLQDILDW